MSTTDTIAIVAVCVAGGSFLLAILALVLSALASSKANTISGEQLKLSHAQVEINVRNQIIDSRRYTEQFYQDNADFLAKDPKKLTDDEKKKRERLAVAANSAIEGYISALDDACQKHLDGKLDKVRFRKGYQREIRQAVQNEAHEDFFKTGHAFHALIKVYEEWENPEKD